MTPKNENQAVGMAALSLCEAMLLVLVEERHIDREHVLEILEDAVEGHLAADKRGGARDAHLEAARLIEEIVVSVCATAEDEEFPPHRATQNNAGAGENRS